MRRFGVLALAAVGLSAFGYAQADQPKGLSARAGFFFPGSGGARDEGATWFGLGFDYKMGYIGDRKVLDRNLSASYGLSLDWYGKGRWSNIPIMFNYTGRESQFYYSVGAGIGFQKTPDGVGGSRSGTKFAYQLSVGYDISKASQAFFVEGKYFGASNSELSGFGLFGGIRF